MHALLTIALLNPFISIFASASRLNINAKTFTLDENSALKLCLNDKSFDEVETLATATSPSKVSPKRISGNSVFEYLRQGVPVPEEVASIENIEESKTEVDSVTNDVEEVKNCSSGEPSLCHLEASEDIDTEYRKSPVQEPKAAAQKPKVIVRNLIPRVHEKANTTNDFDSLPELDALLRAPDTDSYMVHLADPLGRPGRKIDRLAKLMELPISIKHNKLSSNNVSCFLISNSYSSNLLVRNKIIGSKFFSFKVNVGRRKMEFRIQEILRFLARSKTLPRAILASHLRFRAFEDCYTWTIILNDEYEHIAHDFHRKFSKSIGTTEMGTW